MPSAPRIRVRMRARSIDEPHRASSELELLFDLTFVVAVSAVTTQFALRVADGHAGAGVLAFLQVFFAIWWAWMNFTWFASPYGTDDVGYRLLTMVQMAGVLVLAAGVPAAVDNSDYRTVTFGYIVMRIGLVALWLRAGIEYPAGRRTALRYACGISVLQIGWVILLVVSGAGALPVVGPPAPVRRVGGPRTRGAVVGRTGRADHLASTPHRRALRPVHDHPARRERPCHEHRNPERARGG